VFVTDFDLLIGNATGMKWNLIYV